MRRLISVIQQLSLAHSLTEVQEIVRRSARALADADGATFVLRDGDQCHYADEDAIAPLWKGHRFPMSACVSGWAMLHREAVVIGDIYADERVPHDAYRPTFVQSMAMIPIRMAAPIGAIGVYWAKKTKPSADQLELLQALADSTSIAIENVQLIDQLEARVVERTAALEEARAAHAAAQRELEERQRAEAALRKVEDQLRQTQKMEAVGQLAGGIAHDFNNLLSVILTYSAINLADLEADHPLRGDLLEIEKAGQRAAGLVRQILAFSRRQMLEPRVLELNQVVVGIEKMLRRVIGADIAFEVRLDPDAQPVLADPGQLEQVIMNLAVNARDAMPQGGKLTIETANTYLDGAYVASHLGVTPGPYVMLAVSDSGIGMDRETQARIFEPFFTTKERGRGTGLGLSTVYGIVKQSDGHIWVYSEPGRGTSFKVYLPARPDATDAVVAARPSIDRLTGSETILVVEDDAQVRSAARDVLLKGGYRVLLAANAEEALRATEAAVEPIHLLLTDMVMPDMSGVELARRLTERSSTLRILCMSGYTDEAAKRHGLIESGLAYIQKPLTPESLLTKVREVLNA
ncbi:MAG: ATP-binding protein [Myxococcota bacterium]